MRTILLTGLAAALLGATAPAAPPVFGGGYQATRTQAPPARSATQLKPPTAFGRLFGKRPAQPSPATPPPHPFATKPPTTTERISQAITANPVVAALQPNNWGQSRPQPEDALSLNRPVTRPSASLHVSLAAASEQAGDIDTARKHLQDALAAQPGNVAALRRLGRLEDRQGRLDEAAGFYRQAVDADPNHAGALNDLALCFARQGGFAESAQALERAIALRPDKPLYRNNIAKVLVASGDEQRALAHLAAVHPPAIAHFNLGQLLTQAGRRNLAATHLRQSIGFDPNFQPAAAALAELSPAGISAPANAQATAPAHALPAPPTDGYAAPAYPSPPLPARATPQTAAAPQLRWLPPLTRTE